jgi:hypothetical protein
MLFFSKNSDFNYIKQTNKTKNILKEIYNEQINAYNYVKKLSTFKSSIKKILSAKHISKPKIFNANSFPEIIRKHIDETMMAEISYSFSLYDRKIKVFFIVEDENIEINLETYNNYIKLIVMWLYILNIYASKECANTINIYLYFTSLEKKLPKSNIMVIDENNVNTAFTTTCPVDSEIVIFRKEEWFKVLIHETFHNFGLDFSMMNNDLINDYILNIFPVNSFVNAYEAYTEFWAEIINALFCSFIGLRDKQNFNDYISNAEFYITFERKYSFFQLVKTLNFMGLTYTELYSNSDNARLNRENSYKEKTNVLAYFVLKTILINNYQDFLSWCNKNNFSLLNFKKTIGNQKEFCNFIKKNYKTKSMLMGINESQIFLSKLKNENGNMDYILSNMRMSICELG